MAAAALTVASALYWYRPEIGRALARYRPRLAHMAGDSWPCRCRRLLSPLRRAAAAAVETLHLAAVMVLLERYSRAAVTLVVTASTAAVERARQALECVVVVRTALVTAAVAVRTAAAAVLERAPAGWTGHPWGRRAERRRTRTRCVQTEEELIYEYWEGPPLVQVQVGSRPTTLAPRRA